jgi:MscS family membrane protein
MSYQAILDYIAALAPNPWVQALLILVAAALVAKLADFVLTRVAPRLTRRTKTDVDDRIFKLLHRPIFLSVLLIGVNVALLRVVEPEHPYYRYALSLLKTLAILLWLAFAIRLAKLLLAALSRSRRQSALVQPQTLPILGNVATVLIVVGGIYFLLLAWGADISGWVASAGIIGLAVGLAAKDTLANLFAGVSILADAPFKVGDFIVLDSGERGEVTHIGIRSSRILTRDDIEITVPNSILANTKIINEAGGPVRSHRVRVKVGVAYGSNVDQVRAVLLEVAQAHPEVLAEPEPRVRFRNFGDSGLDHELLCWVAEPVQRGKVLDELNTEVYKRFGAEGIEIPYPKRDLYLKEAPNPGALRAESDA